MTTIFREVGSARPARRVAAKGKQAGFARMLKQLSGASGRLQKTRARSKR